MGSNKFESSTPGQARLPDQLAGARLHGQLHDDDECPCCAERESRASLELLKKERTIFISETVTPKLTQRVTTQLLWV